MKIVVTLGNCVVEMDDSAARDSTVIGRYADQTDRLINIIHEARDTVIAMHEQQSKVIQQDE